LITAEEDVETHAEAPHGEQQQEQEPLHIVDDCTQSVNEGVLGRLQHPVQKQSVPFMAIAI